MSLEATTLSGMILESPKLHKSYGISKDQKTDYNIKIKLDTLNAEHTRFIDLMNKIHAECINLMGEKNSSVDDGVK